MNQLLFVIRRLLLTIPMLFVMSIVVFLIIRLVPGDPVRTMLGFRATDQNVAELRHQLGLDRSLLAKTGGLAISLGSGRIVSVTSPGDRHPWRDPPLLKQPPRPRPPQS